MSLERPRFGTTRLTEGYDPGEVDAFVDRVVAALGGAGGLSAEQVRAVRFTPVRLREGYTMGDVDDWLDRVVAALGDGADGVRPPATDAGPASSPDAVGVTEVGGSAAWTKMLLVVLVVAAAVLWAVYDRA